MKIKFNAEELEWLEYNIDLLFTIASKRADSPELVRLTRNMRHKFTPNASMVNLSVLERALLAEMVSKRAEVLGTTVSPDAEIIRQIALKIQEVPSSDANKVDTRESEPTVVSE